jgi:6-phosphogluconolactonase (cycloisomerase 2 family)
MAEQEAFEACGMSFPLITEHMTTLASPHAISTPELGEFLMAALYRLSTYAVVHLIDDAAILSLVFI